MPNYTANPIPPETRSSILSAVRDPANAPAWARFFDLYAGFIYNLAIRQNLPHVDAEDFLSQILAELVRVLPSFQYDPARGRFRGFLHTLVSRRLSRVLRNNAVRYHHELLTPEFDNDSERENVDPSNPDAPAPPPDPSVPADIERMINEEWNGLLRERALQILARSVDNRQIRIFHAAVIATWPTADIRKAFGISASAISHVKKRVSQKYANAIREAERELDNPFPPPP